MCWKRFILHAGKGNVFWHSLFIAKNEKSFFDEKIEQPG